jgi:hypothetical protein
MFLIKNVMALICSWYFITSFPIYMACCCNLSIWQGTCSIFFVIYLILSWNKVLSITSTPLLVAKASLLLFSTRTMVSNYVTLTITLCRSSLSISSSDILELIWTSKLLL